MKKYKVGPVLLGLTMLMSFNAHAGVDGWKQENNGWKYYKENKALKAWQQINNNWYFFNEDGSLKTGWYMDATNNWYFLDSSKTANEGVLLSGWQWIDGYCYYFEGTDNTTFGKMYSNAVVSGYKVDALGRWINESGTEYYEAGKGISTGNASQSSSNTAKKTSITGSSGRSGGSSKGGSSGRSGGSSKGESTGKGGGSSRGESTGKSAGSNIGENTGRSDSLSGLNQGEKREENRILGESKGKAENSSSKRSEDLVGSRQDLSSDKNNSLIADNKTGNSEKAGSIEKNTNKEDTTKSNESPVKPATSSNVEIPKAEEKKDTEPKEIKKPEAERKESTQNRAERFKESLITSKNDNVVQYTNEDGEIRTIIWVKGINGPVMGEGGDFHKEITQGGKDTYVMYTVPYSSGDGWYDVNKTRSGGNIDIDKNLCFAAVSSNMLHWWFDQNIEYVDRYIEKNGDIIRANRKLSDLKTSFENPENSKIFELYKVLYGYNERGFYSDLLMDLFINGYTPKTSGGTNMESDELIPNNNGGFFYDVFKGKKLTDRTYGGNYESLSNLLKEILGNGGIVGLSHKVFSKSNHIVTLWGAEYDLNGKLKAVYISDSDDQDESNVGMKRFEIRNVGGKAKISTNETDKSAGAEVGYLHILYQGTGQWENYFK
ncbi:IdeS/Mac family cysteine endopeptidase [Lachnoanaerobaculum gingivalis]|uniref:IdeS/Mac family cysteine endopeptidase n=1 Tax=Lachnoanaerobaculum gingivalis TaxID=2490855 RepID=UPI0028CFFC8C|nr:IdeS/Mac family cysteine endopeptidase [Lachnoanaerobaculum gingivalis]